jgi:hypothetical protein
VVFIEFKNSGETLMITKRNKRVFRFWGIIIWLSGLLLPWFKFDLEPASPTVLLSGWEEILIGFSTGVEKLKDGFNIFILVSFLEGISLVILTMYIAYAIFLIKGKLKGSRYFSVFLTGIAIVNICFAQIVITDGILTGFWMFLAGLLWCAITEWITE